MFIDPADLLESFREMSFFEIGMLICFGVSWPLSIFKLLKSKTSAGKSFWFLWLVLLGYVLGTCHKIFYHLDPVIALYVFNGLCVLVDLMLSYRYRRPVDAPHPVG
jgi:hypothetical protein